MNPLADRKTTRGSPSVRHAGPGGDEAGRRALEHADLIAGPQRQPGGGGQGPGPAVGAGPDRPRPDGGPFTVTAGHEPRRVSGGRRSAAGGAHVAHGPGPPAVGGHEELGARDPRALLRAHGHDLGAVAGHLAERLADAPAVVRRAEVGAGQGGGREPEGGRRRGRAGGAAAVRAGDDHHGDAEHHHGHDRDDHPRPHPAEMERGTELGEPVAPDRFGQERTQQPGPLGASPGFVGGVGVELEAGPGPLVPGPGLLVPGSQPGRRAPAGSPSGCSGTAAARSGGGGPGSPWRGGRGAPALEFVAGYAVPHREGPLRSGQPGGPGMLVGRLPGGAGSRGRRAPTVRRPPRTPCAATRRISSRIPCHLCLASRARLGGITSAGPYAISADGTGRHPAVTGTSARAAAGCEAPSEAPRAIFRSGPDYARVA